MIVIQNTKKTKKFIYLADRQEKQVSTFLLEAPVTVTIFNQTWLSNTLFFFLMVLKVTWTIFSRARMPRGIWRKI